MSTVAVVLALVALVAIVVSLGSLYYVRANVGYNKRGVGVAERTEREALRPTLAITLQGGFSSHETQWVYRIRNDSELDLRSTTLNPPGPIAGVQYPLSTVGGATGWVKDGPIELGPLPMGHEVLFQLAVGPPTPGRQPAGCGQRGRPVSRVLQS